MKKFLLLILFFPLLAQTPPVTHQSFKEFKIGEKISIWATATTKIDFLLLFYKVGDVKAFQVRKMKKAENDKYYYELDSRRFTHRKLQYHFVTKIKGKYIRIPSEGEFQATGIGELAQVPPEEKVPPIPTKLLLNLNGNIQWTYNIKQKEELPEGTSRSSLNGNLSVSTGVTRGNSSVKINSTGSYIKGEENPANLSSIYAGYTSSHHTLEIGDLSFQAPDLAMMTSGRRGARYALNLNRFKGSAFMLSTRQLSELGLPKGESQYHGANFSVKLGTFDIHGLYLSGKDNPQFGVNSSDLSSNIRKGSVLSMGFSAYLFQNSLSLNGDYFHSSYDDNVIDEVEAKKDSAYSMNGSFSKGIFSLSGSYQRVGANYNSIASSYITNNVENMMTNLSISLPSGLSLSGGLSSMKSNIGSIEGTPRSTNRNYNASFNYSPGKFSFGVGYQLNRQKTEYTETERTEGLPDKIDAGQFTVNLGFTPFP